MRPRMGELKKMPDDRDKKRQEPGIKPKFE
jgi:hypothetical protein